MKDFKKTVLFTGMLSFISIVGSLTIQSKANSAVTTCSYLDPIIVDIAAFLGALFLIIEGIYRVFEHKNSSFKNQITRSLRIAFGFAIITLHVVQLFNK